MYVVNGAPRTLDAQKSERDVCERAVESRNVVGNTRGDGSVPSPLVVHLEANCPIAGVGIEFAGAPTPTPALTREDAGGGTFAFYDVASKARTVDFTVPAGTRVAATTEHKTTTPVASAYCATPHTAQNRFNALFHPQHPDWPFAATKAWPALWAVLGWLGFLATAMSRVAPRRRR
jgi:hypothetical protein